MLKLGLLVTIEIIFIIHSVAHRFIIPGSGYDHPERIVDFDEYYYYKSIHAKMAESLSVSNCTIDGMQSHLYNPKNGDVGDIEVKIYPPNEEVFTSWMTLKNSLIEIPQKHATRRQFVKVAKTICDSKEFKNYSKGNFRRAKGCLKMKVKDPKTKRLIKRINNYGATLHPDHSRCNHEAAIGICKNSPNKIVDYPIEIENETPIANEAYPFLISTKNVIVARSGMFSLPCGPFGLYSSCEATNWGLPLARNFTTDAQLCRNVDVDEHEHEHEHHSPKQVEGTGTHRDAVHIEGCPHPIYNKVFAMCQYDDTQIGQFVLEALPKLIYHLDFVYKNPDMKIHYGFTKRAVLPTFVLPHTIFDWLGLSDRLINGTYYAREAYMPREGGCQEPGYNMWEIYNMRDVVLKRAKDEIGTGGRNNSKGWDYPAVSVIEKDLGPMDYQSNDGDSEKPLVILVKRGASKFTQNQGDFRIRRWPPKLGGAAAVRDALAEQFPDHNIQIFSDFDYELMMCHSCAAQLFNKADVVIGIHGAGLTNCVYMKPGAILVEAIPQFDSRHAPITGIFARLSGMMGLSHYTYDMKDNFTPLKIAADTREFYDAVAHGQPRVMPIHPHVSGHNDHSHDSHTHD